MYKPFVGVEVIKRHKKPINMNMEIKEEGGVLFLMVEEEVVAFICLKEMSNVTIVADMDTWQINVSTICMHVKEAVELDIKDITLAIMVEAICPKIMTKLVVICSPWSTLLAVCCSPPMIMIGSLIPE